MMVAMLSLSIGATAQAASIQVYPTIIDTHETRVAVNVINRDHKPVKLKVFGDGVTVFPPLSTLQPGEKQAFRVIADEDGKELKSWQPTIKKTISIVENLDVQSKLNVEIPYFLNHKEAEAEFILYGDDFVNIGNRQALITRIGDQKTQIWLMPGHVISDVGDKKVYSNDLELVPRD